MKTHLIFELFATESPDILILSETRQNKVRLLISGYITYMTHDSSKGGVIILSKTHLRSRI